MRFFPIESEIDDLKKIPKPRKKFRRAASASQCPFLELKAPLYAN
jgi:hypothetical protein